LLFLHLLLKHSLPNESYLYLGDTARLPYGTKSADTVTKYALKACTLLTSFGIKSLVIACNTVSAYALPTLQKAFPELPIIGVIEPGSIAAVAASKSGHIAVMATEATINNKAYETTISRLNHDAKIIGTSCSLFVALAEEGWVSGEVPQAVAKNYLAKLFGENNNPDCLVLGCTHFPALRPTLEAVIHPGVSIVDSASTTAQAVKQLLTEQNLLSSQPPEAVSITYLATDNPQRFTRVAKNLLQINIDPENIELIDIPEILPDAEF